MQLLAVASLEIELLPLALQPWVLDVSELMQSSADAPGICAIVALAGAVNRRARIQPKALDPTWVVVPNLYGALVIEPGQMKTPILNRMTRPLFNVEAAWNSDNKRTMAEYLNDLEEAKENGDQQPKKPFQRRLVTNDATFEKIQEIVADNPSGLTMIRDELTGWLSALKQKGRESERAFYNTAWDGDSPYNIDRVGRGSVIVPHLCLSVLGTIQPERLRAYMAGEDGVPLPEDGLLQRFQMGIWPDSKPFCYVDREPNKTAAHQAERIFWTLVKLDSDDPMLFKFAPDAQDLFVEWIKRLQQRISSAELTAHLSEHLSKYKSLMPTLALLFELADLAAAYNRAGHPVWEALTGQTLAGFVGSVGGCAIKSGNTKKAIEWCDYLETHARRIYSLIDKQDRGLAELLSKKLLERDLNDEFTPRQVAQKGWRQLTSVEAVKRACKLLTEAGWVREMTKKPNKKGGRPSVHYRINPKIFATPPPTKPT
jgi:hypothetical protein